MIPISKQKVKRLGRWINSRVMGPDCGIDIIVKNYYENQSNNPNGNDFVKK